MAAPGRAKKEAGGHAGGRRGSVLMADPNNPLIAALLPLVRRVH